jgi:hypothetical protein
VTFAIGKTLGPYEVLSGLGASGLGELYRRATQGMSPYEGGPMKYRRSVFVLLTCAAVSLGVPEATSITARAQDDAAITRQFIGMWRLVSWTQRLSDGTTSRPARNVAYIIYTDTSPIHMCYVSMDPNRAQWKSEFTPTPSEAMSGRTGAYCSTVEVHAKEGFVIHRVEIAEVPNLVGRSRKRYFTFDGPNRVSLRVEPTELQPGMLDSILTWEKVQK